MRTALSRRVSTAVGIVLAVSAATPLLAPAAAATPAPAAVAPAAEAATAPIQVPFLASGGRVIGAGKTGFLTEDTDGVARWTRYTDGVSTVIGALDKGVLGSPSDIVVVTTSRLQEFGTQSATVHDMTTGATLGTLGGFRGLASGPVGAAVFDVDHGSVGIVTKEAGFRPIEGLHDPYENSTFTPADSVAGAAFGGWYDRTAASGRLVVVDTAGARVTESYPLAADVAAVSGCTITQDRVRWVETSKTDGRTVLATAVRGSSEVTREPMGFDGSKAVTGGALGDWLLSPGVAADQGFMAYSVTDAAPVKLLDHAESVQKAADGTVLALGTTADRGPGVYRISPGGDGKPAAELIASTGRPPGPTTPVTFTSAAVPAVIDFDGVAKTPLRWKFSTTEIDLKIDLTYRPTSSAEAGASFVTELRPRTTGTGILPDGSLGIDWAGETAYYGKYRQAAPTGTYDWKVTARPWNGMPSVTATGSFELKRSPGLHDYTANGSSDVFARLSDGTIDVLDTRWDDDTQRLVVGERHSSRLWWGDWNSYDRVEATGDIAGTPAIDTVARDRSGVLWLHEGRNVWSGGLPKRIGAGWGVYRHLAGGSDLTGDGRSDLVAVDTAGDLYLYTGTGSASAPFAKRVKTGWGWNIYHQITAVGNIAGAPAGDLVARDKAGVLWLYLGKGDGTFAPRVKIGAGWNEYTDLVGIGDANKDGRPDLYARTTGTNKAYFYAGTGNWRTPFAPRATTTAGVAPTGTTYNHTF